ERIAQRIQASFLTSFKLREGTIGLSAFAGKTKRPGSSSRDRHFYSSPILDEETMKRLLINFFRKTKVPWIYTADILREFSNIIPEEQTSEFTRVLKQVCVMHKSPDPNESNWWTLRNTASI